MNNRKTYSEVRQQCFTQGIVYGLIPFLVISCGIGLKVWDGSETVLAFGGIAVLLMLAGNSRIFAKPLSGRALFFAGLVCNTLIVLPGILSDPFLALLYGVIFLTGILYLATRKNFDSPVNRFSCFSGAGLALLVTVFVSPVFNRNALTDAALSISSAVVMFLYLRWQIAARQLLRGVLAAVVFVALLAVAWYLSLARVFLFVFAVLVIFAVRFSRRPPDIHWLAGIAMHPARFLGLTFIVLPLLGMLLLRTGIAMKNPLSVVDVAFTAVSGVCVTGLSVIDISSDLTFAGQIILLILIQLGGLGIVSIATLILHAVGRFSLNEERLANDLSPRDGQELMQRLKQVLGFSLAVEIFGCLLLWGAFLHAGESAARALWLGVFTGISAFCNSGFFPGPESLQPYNTAPILLFLVTLLMIAGGTAPVLSDILIRVRTGKPLTAACRIILATTGILLAGGMVLILIMEWNGILGGLGIVDKLSNAWFMSASLRSGGFNTVAVGGVMNSLYVVMLVLMFIGGSPGGTAGGVKTTSIAVLFLTFRSAVSGKKYVTCGLHRISYNNIMQAVAIIFAWAVLCVSTVILLAATQDISFRKAVFEGVSALGTVGMSIGATTELDEVGRIILMLAMFIGRIGPLTFFLLLSENRKKKEPGLPEIDLPLG